MEIDVIRQFGELMDAFGLKLERISRNTFDKVSFDAGLRRSLQDNYDYESGIRRMEEHYEDNVVYMIRDIFETHYVSFLIPERLWEGTEMEFLQLGPYITRNPEEMIDGVMEKNDLPILFRKELEEYYYGIPLIRSEELLESIIEACMEINELEEISHEMMRKYCLLVRNHSLKGYSPMIRDTLNYIDFNLKEPLSLKLLAEKVNVNASYLSTQFRKETGKTVTEYINEKRVHSSLVFLATTDMPIQTVAEQVGIYDENYFARLFKKYQNQTAKQYRNLMQSKI